MAETAVRKIKVGSLDDPEFEQVGWRIAAPQRDPGRESQFWPALSGFDIGEDSHVDVSYLESSNRTPKGGFDRHLRTQELFVCLEGEYLMPMASCRDPDDPEDLPRAEDLICFRVKAGDMYVLKANVWHNGGWPAAGAEKMRYIMVLSGHRAGAGHQGRVDHIVKQLPDGLQVVPEE